jgi:DNA repair protein RadD
MRIKSHADHCLVLDFAGVVASHGPITAVQPPKKGGDGNGEAPVKICANCEELCAISVMVCPACGHPFPVKEIKKLQLHDDDIMGLDGTDLDVTSWTWRKHISKASGKEMLAVTYYGGLSDPAITEYLAVTHDGYAGQMAMQKLVDMVQRAQIEPGGLNVKSLEEMVTNMNKAQPPIHIEFKRDGKFFRVMRRKWA